MTPKYLEWLIRDAGVVELRHQTDSWKTVGWFSDPDELLRAARRLDQTGNLFTSLHRPHGEPSGPIRNEDIKRFTRLLFDFDPIRPAGMPSTECELQAAKDLATRFQAVLRKLGVADPLRAVSGNGVHLQYRVALPNDEHWRQALKVIYRGMSEEFSTESVSFDAAVRNPGRICCLYGSTKRKGPDTPERPHRQSSVWIPREWKQVRKDQLQRISDFYAEQLACPVSVPTGDFVTGSGDYSSLDVVSWFQAHGHYEKPIDGHIHAVRCPWEAEHTESNPNDSIIFEATGSWPGFFCHHSHCEGRNIRDVMSVWGDADSFCTSEWREQK